MNLIFTSDLPGLGGGEVGIIYLAEELSKEHSCFVICRKDGPLVEALRKKEIPTVVIDYKNRTRLLKETRALRKAILDFEPDAIFSNDPSTSLLIHLCLSGTNIPTFWIAHGQWYQFGMLKRFLLKRWNSKILCVSNNVNESLRKQGLDNLVTTRLGVPVDLFARAEPAALRKQLGLDDDVPLIITVARFQKIKGQLKAVKAAKMLKDAGDKFCYAFVGGSIFGSEDDLKYQQEVIRYAEEEGLAEKEVVFLGERRDIPGIMKEADCLVIPSDNESLGVVALEAMASKLFVISTPNDGVSEVFRNDSRHIAPSNDEKGLFVLIHSFLNDSDAREESIAKYEEYSIRYRSDVVANAFIKAVTCRNHVT